MPSVDTAKITIALKTSARRLLVDNAKGSVPTAQSPGGRGAVSGEVPAIVNSTDFLSSTGLTLSGVVDDEAEIVLDALKVADA